MPIIHERDVIKNGSGPAKIIDDEMLLGGKLCEDADEFFRGQGRRSIVVPTSRGIKRTDVGTEPADGGYLTNPNLIERFNLILESRGMRRFCTRISTPDGTPRKWPTVDGTANPAAILTEHTEATPVDPVFAEAVIVPYHYVTAVTMSLQLLSDQFDAAVGSIIGEILAHRIQVGSDADMLGGDGTSKPFGLHTRAIAGGADGETMQAVVDSAYWFDQGGWVADPINAAALLTAAVPMAGGEYAFRGSRLWVHNGCPGIVFGGLRNYVIHDAGDLVLTIASQAKALSHQVDIIASYRVGGNLQAPAVHACVARDGV